MIWNHIATNLIHHGNRLVLPQIANNWKKTLKPRNSKILLNLIKSFQKKKIKGNKIIITHDSIPIFPKDYAWNRPAVSQKKKPFHFTFQSKSSRFIITISLSITKTSRSIRKFSVFFFPVISTLFDSRKLDTWTIHRFHLVSSSRATSSGSAYALRSTSRRLQKLIHFSELRSALPVKKYRSNQLEILLSLEIPRCGWRNQAAS